MATTVTSSAPLAERANDQIANTVQRGLHLTALSDIAAFSALGASSLTDLAAFDGIPALQQFLQDGNVADFVPADDGSGGYAALSGLNAYIGDGSITDIAAFSALGSGIESTDAFNAIPVFQQLAAATNTQEAATALGGYAATSAANTFFGSGSNEFNDPTDPTKVTGTTGGVFTGGGVNALAPGSDGSGGYAALSALPVFVGTDPNAPFGQGVFTGGGVDALSNYAALSAIPAYVDAASSATSSTAATPTQKLAASAPADPAPADSTSTTQTKSNNKAGQSYAGVFKPTTIELFGSGGGKNSSDNGIRGWGDMLKKAGLNGGDSSSASGSGG